MALRPNIPDVSLVEDPLVREALQAIKRIIDIREGVVGEETFVQKNSLQSGQQTNGAGWVKVTFPKAFTVIPKLVVSGVKDDSTSPDFFVETRSITVSGFEFKTIDGGGTDSRIRFFQKFLAPAQIPAHDELESQFALTGINTDDLLVVNAPAQTTGIVVLSYAIATDLASLFFVNVDTVARTPVTGVYKIVAINRLALGGGGGSDHTSTKDFIMWMATDA